MAWTTPLTKVKDDPFGSQSYNIIVNDLNYLKSIIAPLEATASDGAKLTYHASGLTWETFVQDPLWWIGRS